MSEEIIYSNIQTKSQCGYANAECVSHNDCPDVVLPGEPGPYPRSLCCYSTCMCVQSAPGPDCPA
jgi:hypothetical protein